MKLKSLAIVRRRPAGSGRSVRQQLSWGNAVASRSPLRSFPVCRFGWSEVAFFVFTVRS